MVQRLQRLEQIRGVAPALAATHNEAYAATPNYRPITAEEILRKACLDHRLEQRLIYVWTRGTEVLAWCNVEPPSQANIGGDLYPYVGGEMVLQPSLIALHPDWRGCGLEAKLLTVAATDLAAGGKPAMQLILSEEDQDARALYHEAGFREIGRMVSLRATLAQLQPDPRGVTTRRLRTENLPQLLRLHNAAFAELCRLRGWQALSVEDLDLLRQSVTGYDDRGVLLAYRDGEPVGYVAAMVDPVFNEQHGDQDDRGDQDGRGGQNGRRAKRGWIGLAQLGLTVAPELYGQGLGSGLMAAALVYLAGRQMKEAELITDLQNHQAVAFYTALGFEAVREWPVLEWRF